MNSRMIPIALVMILVVSIPVGPAVAQDGEKLIESVMYQDLEAVKELVESGADVNYQDKNYGGTPLIMACGYNMVDIARYLIEKGADVNFPSKRGDTPLIAAAGRSLELVELLLSKGADVKAVGPDSLTAFTSCIVGVLSERVTTDVAKLLLEKGAEVDEAPPSGGSAGYTCLMMAARNAAPDLVKFLVENGADVNAKAGDGSTPIGIAREKKDEKMVQLLLELGAKE